MNIRTMILSVIAVSLLITVSAIVVVSSLAVNDLGDVTSDASSHVLEDQATENLANIALGMRDQLDHQMADQYQLVRTWALSPILVETARTAQTRSLEELYERWSATATREYDEGEAVGDGNPANDLNPEASEFLKRLSESTGSYPEIFITDSRGYAIAASAATGDFDQGPDDWRVFLNDAGAPYLTQHKPAPGGEGWYKAANEAEDGLYVSAVEYDNSAATWGIDIVSVITDPDTGEYLGQIKAVLDYGALVTSFTDIEGHHGGGLDIYELKLVDADGLIVATSEHSDSEGAHAEAEEVLHDDVGEAEEADHGEEAVEAGHGDEAAEAEEAGHGDEAAEAEEADHGEEAVEAGHDDAEPPASLTDSISSKVNNPDVTLSGLHFFSEIQNGVHSGTAFEVDEDGEQVYVAYAVSDDVNGHVVVASNTVEDIQGPINAFTGDLRGAIGDAGTSLLIKIVVIGSIIALVMLTVAFLIVNWRISAPIAKLTAASAQISQGNIEGLDLGDGGSDEIGQLADSFRGVVAAFSELLSEATKKA